MDETRDGAPEERTKGRTDERRDHGDQASSAGPVDDQLAGLRTWVEGWAPTADLDEVAHAAALLDRAQAKLYRAIGMIDGSESWADEGATSTTAWLTDRLGMGSGHAGRVVRTARRLRTWSAVAEAWEDGALSGGQVEAVAANVSAPAVDLFSDHAADLVPLLAGMSASDTATVVRGWDAYAEAVLDPDGERARARRSRLCHSRTLDGRHRFDGDFDAEAGAIVALALGAATTPDVGGEPGRHPAERRADAFADICRAFLDGSSPDRAEQAEHAGGGDDADVSDQADGGGSDGNGAHPRPVRRPARRRPHLHVLCDVTVAQPWLRDLEGHHLGLLGQRDHEHDHDLIPRRLVDRFYAAAGRARLVDGTPLDAQTTRRLLCDADVHRVITAAPTSVLDHGRATRTIPPALHRALLVRDRGCRWPGCDRPPQWTEAHHVIPWQQRGPTDLGNTVFLCTRHHHLTHGQAGHPRGWNLELLSDGTVQTTSPTGQTRQSRPPP